MTRVRDKQSNPKNRDELLTRARYGEITPEAAEAKAKANGWDPFERQPEIPEFDPMMESRWSIVMAVAWIAWRDLGLVREQQGEFRSQSTMWIHRGWNEWTEQDETIIPRNGWFLETWREATTVRLAFLERALARRDALPATAQLNINDAELALWRALAEGALVAEALDATGKPADIPQREWSFLKLYEDGKRDVLKYDALDRETPYSRVRFKRTDLFRLWPPASHYQTVSFEPNRPIEPGMLQPLLDHGHAGYVPLCAAVHWIMTRSGARIAAIDDQPTWEAAAQALLPLLQTEHVEIVGLPRGGGQSEKMHGYKLATIKIIPPGVSSIGEKLLNAPAHIDCCPYFGKKDWLDHSLNDRLYLPGQVGPAWTHLQVKKADILSRWPRPESRLAPEQDCRRWLLKEIERAGGKKSRSKNDYWSEARIKFPPIAHAQFKRAWETAVAESGATAWSQSGRMRKLNRSAE